MTARCLSFCSALLLFANGAYGGTYQSTKDGRTRVWNNYPTRGDRATWSGNRDANGYATGDGTLTWYKVEPTVVTGSNIPSARGAVVGRYSGHMVRGKLEGPVINVDANGKTFHGTFVDGRKTADWTGGPPPALDRPPNKYVGEGVVPEPPAQGPALATARPLNEPVHRRAVSATPTLAGDLQQSVTPSPSLGAPAVAEGAPQAPIPLLSSSPPPGPAAIDPAVRGRMIADLKEQTRSVLTRVADATGSFSEIDRLDSVKQLPGPISENVSSLIDRARDVRSKLGYEKALQECRTETETVDALSVVDQITRNLAANNAPEARSRLAVFLKSNPDPIDDSQKGLWRYLTSMQLLCNRLEKDAAIHWQRAQTLTSAGKTSEAIREYQEAYRTFPNPTTAEKIHQLQDNSLGL